MSDTVRLPTASPGSECPAEEAPRGKQRADWPPGAATTHKPQKGHILDRQCPATPAPAAVESRVPGATHGERLRCLCGGQYGYRDTAGCAALALLSSASCARRPPAEPPGSRGGGAASPVPGAGWRRARTLGPGLGAPPAGTPEGPPRGEGSTAQATSRFPASFPARSPTCCAVWVKSMSSMTIQPGPTPQKIVFLTHLRTP